MKWINWILCLACITFLGWITWTHGWEGLLNDQSLRVMTPETTGRTLEVSAERLRSVFGGGPVRDAEMIGPHVNGKSPDVINAVHRYHEILAEAKATNAAPPRTLAKAGRSHPRHSANTADASRSARNRLGFIHPKSVFTRSRRYAEFGANFSKSGDNLTHPRRSRFSRGAWGRSY